MPIIFLGLLLYTTDRLTDRASVPFRRIDVAIAVEVKDVRAAIVSRSRPIVAAEADIVETAIVVAITRSRIPDGGRRAELAREVHTFVGAVV